MVIHMMSKSEWTIVQDEGLYRPDSLESEGFIHCATPDQTVYVANTFFEGQSGLVLLVIDPRKVQADLVYEDLIAAGTLFPHIYGPLNLDAVTKVVSFEPNEQGEFIRPTEI
ncbi:DUF952 domain-containing protein [Pontibacillus salipaludis]|uniref:DUF952 domain-containing protein n=1 Tax=Pontibacillus salipaludis TaxID=1697394 RepID=UPI0031E4EE35